MTTLERAELFIALVFLQYADFVSTWLFSLVGVSEGNGVILAYQHGGTLLEKVVAIKLLCVLILANALLRKRQMGWSSRKLAALVSWASRGRRNLNQAFFARALCAFMLFGILWNLLAAWSNV